MKYRILIQKIINTNQEVLSYYMESNNTPWEVEDESMALNKFKDLLQKYSAGNLSLISPVDVSIVVSS
jgi:hypothetical protein